MFLTINGVTVPVAVDSVSMTYVDSGGEMERSPSGELAGGPNSSKREWRMTTTPVHPSEVDAWVGLIEGKGHSWAFDTSFYSSRGRGPSSGTAPIVTAAPRWGVGCLPTNAGNSIAWNVGLGAAWTLVWWSKPNGTFWTHWLTRSDEVTWESGSASSVGALLGEVSVVSGELVFYGADGSDWHIDDAVVLPYVVPDSWASPMYSFHNTQAWSALPRVTAEGDFSTSAVTVRGKVSGSKVIRCEIDGTLVSAHALEFTLREV